MAGIYTLSGSTTLEPRASIQRARTETAVASARASDSTSVDAVLLDRWDGLVSALGERYGGREAVYAVSMAGQQDLPRDDPAPGRRPERPPATRRQANRRLTTTIDAYARAFLRPC
jgi:hypothetical protein